MDTKHKQRHMKRICEAGAALLTPYLYSVVVFLANMVLCKPMVGVPNQGWPILRLVGLFETT
jgi:hypothetical protein